MDFKKFTNQITELKKIELGGLEAQFKLAPKLRLKYDKQKIQANNPKKAAVLALFYPNKNNETSILLTQRASYKGTHSAQISFPGGKVEKTDKNLQETALREAFEEVGIHKDDVTVIREMTDVYIPPSNFLATPFIAYANAEPKYLINHEVDSTIEITVNDLLSESSITSITMNTSYMDNIDVPAFSINNKIIWGATGMMLSEIKDLLKTIY
jgi:8-oxo-dGTP pyrophosphatase MutT (NUDIX family)